MPTRIKPKKNFFSVLKIQNNCLTSCKAQEEGLRWVKVKTELDTTLVLLKERLEAGAPSVDRLTLEEKANKLADIPILSWHVNEQMINFPNTTIGEIKQVDAFSRKPYLQRNLEYFYY